MSLRFIAVLVSFTLGLAGTSTGQGMDETPFDTTIGPATAPIGGMAEIDIGENVVHLGAADTKRLLVSMDNLTNGRELATLIPDHRDWMLFFEFEDVGYIEDDETLDADDLLASLRDNMDAGNEERRRLDLDEMELVGWESEPAYNPTTNNLEWGLRLASLGSPFINHDIRLLGRRGVMSVTLACDPAVYDAAVAEVQQVLEGFRFTDGHRYNQYVSGDKVAEYGLAALVTGGAAAAALKMGFFKKFGKLIAVAAVAIAGFFKTIWGKITGRTDDTELANE